MKKAFTLIELLVVVLIIGILASIALPQYQTAVNKSRYAGLMPLARAVKDAEEEMIMAKGDYTSDLTELSIQMPGSIKSGSEGSIMEVGDDVEIEVFSNGKQDFVKASRANLPNTLVMYFDKSKNFAGGIHCEAAKNGDTVNKRAKQLCESLGGQLFGGVGTSTDYVTYILQGPTTGTGSGDFEWTWTYEDWGDWHAIAYDSNNVKRREGYCSGEDISTCYEVTTWDENGNKIKYANDMGGIYETYEYDENNNKIYEKFDNGMEIYTQRWNESGIKIYDERIYGMDGSYELNEYDDYGNMTHYKHIDPYGWDYDTGEPVMVTTEWTANYVYDDQGNVISCSRSDGKSC